MPQLHTPQLNRLYAEVAAWGLRLADDHPNHRILWGGDFQSTTTKGTGNPAFTSLLESHLHPLHPPIPTFPRSGGCLDHWLTTPPSPLVLPPSSCSVFPSPSHSNDHFAIHLVIPAPFSLIAHPPPPHTHPHTHQAQHKTSPHIRPHTNISNHHTRPNQPNGHPPRSNT